MVNHMRHTRSHTGNRRSHHALKARVLSMCSECGSPKENHAICANCGKYKSRTVVDVHAVLAKKEKKMKARSQAAAGKKEDK